MKMEKSALAHYEVAKELVIKMGYQDDIDFYKKAGLDDYTAETFLRELAWIALNSGFRATTVRKFWKEFSGAFFDWIDVNKIVRKAAICRRSALHVFNNEMKVDSIIKNASIIDNDGWDKIKEEIEEGGVDYLERFSFIGKITKYHLGMNLGMDVSKPDRHMVRLAAKLGYESSQELCESLSDMTGDRISAIDYTLWRAASQGFN